MIDVIQLYRRFRVRSAFMQAREDIYEKMIEELEKGGAKRSETLSALFGAWARRDARRNHWLSVAHASISWRMNAEGLAFSDTLAHLAPFEERMVIWGGEQQGELVDSLHHALRIKRTLQEMKDNALAAAFQPVYWFLNVCVTACVLGFMVWPDMLDAIPAEFWPGWALPSISFDMWFARNWPVVGIIVPVLVAYIYALPRWTGRSRQLADRIFPWAAYREEQSNILLTTLAGLIRNKFTITHACEAIRTRSTPYLRWHLNRVVTRIPQMGENALGAFDTGLISRPVMDRLEDAKRNRDLDRTIEHVGDKSLAAMVRIARRYAERVSIVASIFFICLFLYSAAVQLIATQEASDAYGAMAQRVR